MDVLYHGKSEREVEHSEEESEWKGMEEEWQSFEDVKKKVPLKFVAWKDWDDRALIKKGSK